MMERGEMLQAIKSIPFLGQLQPGEAEYVAEKIQVRRCRRGEILFLEEEPGEALFVLFDGLVRLTKLNEEGKEQVLHYVHPGGVFAEVVLFDGGPYPATAEAVEESLVGALANRDMEELVLSNSALALSMLQIMSRRLRAAQMAIRDLGLHDADERLTRLLLKLAGRYGEETPEGMKIETWITRQEMAAIIGTTRETVARALSRFQKMGLLQLDKGAIILKDGFGEGLEGF